MLRFRFFFGVCALLLALALASPGRAATTFEFGTIEQGRSMMAARDEYVQRLSPLERSLKAKSEAPVNEDEFRGLLGNAVQEWSDADRAAVRAALDSIRAQLVELRLPLPETIVFVRFSGAEGNSPHTRANAVMLTERSLQRQACCRSCLLTNFFISQAATTRLGAMRCMQRSALCRSKK